MGGGKGGGGGGVSTQIVCWVGFLGRVHSNGRALSMAGPSALPRCRGFLVKKERDLSSLG